jgi:hypothetical protein
MTGVSGYFPGSGPDRTSQLGIVDIAVAKAAVKDNKRQLKKTSSR